MKVMRNWIVALTIVSLLAVGVVAVAGGGFRGNSAPCSTDKAERWETATLKGTALTAPSSEQDAAA